MIDISNPAHAFVLAFSFLVSSAVSYFAGRQEHDQDEWQPYVAIPTCLLWIAAFCACLSTIVAMLIKLWK